MKITITPGTCGNCRHSKTESYDPSPAGVSLSPGCMYDWACAREDELPEEKGLGEDEQHQCPLWEMVKLQWCSHHKQYFYEECDPCMDEQALAEAAAQEDSP